MTLGAKALFAWLALLAVMFGNGTLRVIVLQPRLGEELARGVASLIGVAVVFGTSAVFVRTSRRATPRQFLVVGLLWLGLTLTFEFLFGRYVSGASWDALLADYDLAHGRLWPLVLLATLVSPWVWGFVRRAKENR